MWRCARSRQPVTWARTGKDRDEGGVLAPPCPVPWESRRSVGGGQVHFVFYATDDQAREILAEVSARGFSEARLFTCTGEDGQPIDGSTVIEQFQVEQGLPGS